MSFAKRSVGLIAGSTMRRAVVSAVHRGVWPSSGFQTRAFHLTSAVSGEYDNMRCKTDINKPSDQVADIADEILALNLMEINQFLRYLQKRMAVPEEVYMNGPGAIFGGGGGVPMGGAAKAGGAGKAGAAAAAEVKKEAFDLKLTEVPAAAKIKIIKEIRAITGLGLKEAKEMVENAPVVVKKDLKKEEAEKLKATLVEAGGKAELL